MDWPWWLYGAGMHDWLMDELELGARVAAVLDMEANMDPLWWVTDYYMEHEWPSPQDG